MSPVGHRRTLWMNVSDLDTHRSNKREAFDGMRAYHQGELSQKNDCIEILKAILTVSLLAYGGLLAIVHGRQLDMTSGEPWLSSSSPSPASRSLGRSGPRTPRSSKTTRGTESIKTSTSSNAWR